MWICVRKRKKEKESHAGERKEKVCCPISGSCAFQNIYYNVVDHCYSKVEKYSGCVFKIVFKYIKLKIVTQTPLIKHSYQTMTKIVFSI